MLVLVGRTAPDVDDLHSAVRRAARSLRAEVLVGVHADQLVVVLGGLPDLDPVVQRVSREFGPGPVVVGVDCRPGTAELIGAAVDEACVRGSSLVVLHAWRVHGTGPSSAAPPEHSVAQAEADLLERLVADVRTGHPAVPVELVLRPGTAADRLLEAAESAAVLVLGRHGLRPRVPARRTSGWVLDRVGCPVLVVPVGADVRRPRGVVRARTSAR
ncbi:hypothetical protein GCM10023162_37580 [Klenkia terrae]